MTDAAGPVRAAGLAQIAWGGWLLARGPRLWQLVDGAEPTAVDLLAVKALAGRHLVQGAAQAIRPTAGRTLFLAVDVIHVATMLVLASADRPRRRPALLTAAVATANAAVLLSSRRRR